MQESSLRKAAILPSSYSRWLRCGRALTPRATFLPVLPLPTRPSTSRSATVALPVWRSRTWRRLARATSERTSLGPRNISCAAIEHFTAAGFRRVPGSVAYTFGAASLNAWALGRADTARERMRQAIAGGSENNSPYEKTWAQSLAAELQIHLREPTEAEAIAEQVVKLSDERGFSQFTGAARIILGWARANLGHTSEGVALIRQGLKDGAEAGSILGWGGALTALANAQALDGKIADALATIEKVHPAGEHRPEALNVRGELRLKTGQPELAEADFREAIALAQKMCAKAWELRATMSLAALLAKERPPRRSPHDARRNLWLVHRRLRHSRSERRKSAARGTGPVAHEIVLQHPA